MKKLIVFAFLLALLMFAHDSESLGGRGRGGGGRAGGGVVHSYGGGAAARTTTSVVGGHGGTGQASRGAASYTTKGGATVDYRGATAGGTTTGGVSGARHVGGVQVTGAGGNTATHVGRSAAAVGPAGNAVGGKAGTTVGTGPGGNAFATKYKGGVAIGPQGAAAGGTRVGAVGGPGGVAVGGSRAGAAVGPYGAAAGRTTVATSTRGTYYRSTTAIRSQGAYVRHGVAAYPCFRPNWYAQYPGAWFAAGWTANAVWRAATWPAFVNYGYPADPIYYDYGTNVVYQDDGVYFDGEKAYSAEQYAQKATTLADTGKQANVTKDEEWLPLGVFAMAQGDENTSNHIFQLSINKDGVIRGNYYDAVTDTTSLVYGSADKKTQRAAWTVGDRKTPVYEVGLANLTLDQTTMLVHYGADRTQQFTLVRVEAPPEEKK
jgi:hypothetical protein